jgi:hypothetical protein
MLYGTLGSALAPVKSRKHAIAGCGPCRHVRQHCGVLNQVYGSQWCSMLAARVSCAGHDANSSTAYLDVAGSTCFSLTFDSPEGCRHEAAAHNRASHEYLSEG